VAAWWSGPTVPRRGLRRALERRSITEVPPEVVPDSLDVLVVLSVLPDPPPDLDPAPWEALRPGGTLVDLASPRRRRAGELLRPWVHARRLREAAAMRVRHWLELGAFEAEQWVTVEPADVVVTMVRRGHPGAHGTHVA